MPTRTPTTSMNGVKSLPLSSQSTTMTILHPQIPTLHPPSPLLHSIVPMEISFRLPTQSCCGQPDSALTSYRVWGSHCRSTVTNSSVGEHHPGLISLIANAARIENEIVGEALIALKHEELKEMNILSVGHRLTILKGVYDVKVRQEIPIESDHYIPPCKCPNGKLSSIMTDPF